jgi:hypothetical protein
LKRRLPRLGENLSQPAEKGFRAAPEFFEALSHRQVSFDRGGPFFSEHNALASEVKEKGTHRFLSHRVNLDGNLDPPGVLRWG